MNQNNRQKLIAKIKQQGLPGQQNFLPIVSLEDFFIGNDDFGSIGCNLIDHPGPQVFHEILQTIRNKPEVQDVLVEIAEVREQDVSTWPFSEIIYILTSAVQSQVEAWLFTLRPDEIVAGYMEGIPSAAIPPLQSGMKVYSAWWD